ncbi:MAG: hypothetical protein IKK34_09505 [Clostridia bacterium]|nr:hypothetical protein [Clostridia bacterium]
MNSRRVLPVLLALLLFSPRALADIAPACGQLGSERHASHLVSHIYAYTDGWDGAGPSSCPDEGCLDYGHVHCYGVRVTLWDTPNKGLSRVPYYPGGTSSKVGPDTEFQLTDVVSYKGRYYAAIRVLHEGSPIASGYVNADYIGCDCTTRDRFMEIPEYIHDHGAFSLK